MAKAQIDNHGPGPVLVELDDGSWHEIPAGETFVGEIRVVNNGKRRAHYTFGPYVAERKSRQDTPPPDGWLADGSWKP